MTSASTHPIPEPEAPPERSPKLLTVNMTHAEFDDYLQRWALPNREGELVLPPLGADEV